MDQYHGQCSVAPDDELTVKIWSQEDRVSTSREVSRYNYIVSGVTGTPLTSHWGERRLHLDCQSAGDWTVAALAWTVQCTVHCTLYCTVSSNTHLHSTVLSTWLHKGTIRDIYQLLLFLLSNLLNSDIPGLPSLFPSWTLRDIKLLTIGAKHLISTLKQTIDKELGQRNSRTWIAMHTDL